MTPYTPDGTADFLPSLAVLQSELEAYRRTGLRLHLAHPDGAPEDARAEIQNLIAKTGLNGANRPRTEGIAA